MEYITLNNGVKMPIIGFGVYQIPPTETEQAVLEAIKLGYRAIDTAQAYMNEKEVGDAIKKCGIPRDQLFIETKIWITNYGEEKAEKSFMESLEKLQVEYIDLVILHQAVGDYYGAYRALEKMYKQGKVRAIGVSNFFPDRLLDLIMFSEVTPALNQVETHVFNQQIEAHELMKKYNVCHQAWSPLVRGLTAKVANQTWASKDKQKSNIFDNQTILEIAKNHNKTPAQIALRFLIQRDITIIPRTVHVERMKENMEIFDFELSNEEMEQIFKLDQRRSQFFDHRDPKIVEWFGEMVRNAK